MAKKAHAAGLVFRKSKQRLPPSTIHQILRKRIYYGDFDYNGTTYHGTHQPLVTKATWDCVQQVLDARFTGKHRKVRHDFTYTGTVRCGHCGCSMVGERKKGRYTYYHCTGYKGHCPEPLHARRSTHDALPGHPAGPRDPRAG